MDDEDEEVSLKESILDAVAEARQTLRAAPAKPASERASYFITLY